MSGGDLLARAAALVDIPSVSHRESTLVDHLERELRAHAWLTVDRVGDNLVARTQLGREARVLLGGHSDTVPPNGNEGARLEGDTLWGLGSADMKGGVAVMMALAADVPEPAVDVTYVVYAREEVAAEHNGLRELFAERPELLDADVAVLGEPTSGVLEAGCQGTMRFDVTLVGERAHTARPWMGRNAIHRLEAVLAQVGRFDARQPEIDGCRYREALQAVAVQGGVAGNVVPDVATLTLNHRFAPDRRAGDAERSVRQLLAPVLEAGDRVEVVDWADGALPSLGHPLLRGLIDRNQLAIEAKLGWTDVAFFAERGIPAANLGPGDPLLAHTAGERVDREPLDRTYAVLADLLTHPVSGD